MNNSFIKVQLFAGKPTGVSPNNGKGRNNYQRQPRSPIKELGQHAVKETATAIIKEAARFLIPKALGLLLSNHPQWYGKYDLKNIVGANFGTRKGTALRPSGTAAYSPIANLISVIGLRTELMYNGLKQNGLLQAAQYMYSKLRAANSGAINYSATELINYIYCVRELHALFAVARRAVATLNNVSTYDATRPKSIFTALGLDYGDAMDNAATLRTLGELFANQMRVTAPGDCDILTRARWMFSNLFADSNDVKASLWAFTIGSVHVFNPDGTVNTTFDIDSIADIITALRSMLPVFNSIAKYQIIAGDMLKAFGNAALVADIQWPVNFPTPITYDEIALTQIQNASLMPVFLPGATVDYSSVTISFAPVNGIVGKIVTATAYPEAYGDGPIVWANPLGKYSLIPNNSAVNFINSPKDSVNPLELLSYTRLAYSIDAAAAVAYGTEICTIGKSVYLNVSGVETVAFGGGFTGTRTLDAAGVTTTDAAPMWREAWPQVDWAPNVVMVNSVLVANNINRLATTITNFLWDYNNYAIIEENNLMDFHTFAAMSLLKLGDVAETSKWKAVADKV